MVQQLCKTVWRFLTKLISLWPNNHVPRYLYNWHENLCPHKTCTWMFLAALFVMVSNWGQPRYPSIGEWINKSWYIYILEYDSVIVRNELPSRHGNTQMNLKYIFGSERSQSRKATYCMILCIWHFGKVQTIETLNTWVVAQQLQWRGWIDDPQGNIRVVKLSDTVMVHTWYCTYQNPQNVTAQSVNLHLCKVLKSSFKIPGWSSECVKNNLTIFKYMKQLYQMW